MVVGVASPVPIVLSSTFVILVKSSINPFSKPTKSAMCFKCVKSPTFVECLVRSVRTVGKLKSVRLFFVGSSQSKSVVAWFGVGSDVKSGLNSPSVSVFVKLFKLVKAVKSKFGIVGGLGRVNGLKFERLERFERLGKLGGKIGGRLDRLGKLCD